MATGGAEAGAGWSEVPHDLLWLIIRRLPVTDYIRFGAVCVSWHATLSEKRCRPAGQTPWLAVSGTSYHNSSRIRFLNLSENNKEYHMELQAPEIGRHQRWVGSSEGWLISVDEVLNVHMFDPISRSNMRLPSITTLPDVLRPYLNRNDQIDGYYVMNQQWPYYPLNAMQYKYFRKVIVTSPRRRRRSFLIAAAICSFSMKLAITGEGYNSWTLVGTPGIHHKFMDIIFFRNQLFATTKSGEVVACDLSYLPLVTVTLRVQSPELGTTDPDLLYMYLVESGSGELLQVWERNSVVRVYKMDPAVAGDGNKWIELKCLGDHALFLDRNYSLSLSTQEFPEVKRNCLYFTRHLHHYGEALAYRYNMEDQTAVLFGTRTCWFGGRPLWFTPVMKN